MDLTGLRFGKLVVLRLHNKKNGKTFWLCKCDCGNTTQVRSTNLKNGNTKSCGCLNNKYKELIGTHQKNGKLKAIGYINGKLLCECDCGNITQVRTYNFRKEKTKSCGCISRKLASERAKNPKNLEMLRKRIIEIHKRKIKDLTGIHQKKGRLTALKLSDNRKHNKVTWVCKCDCGNIVEVTTCDFSSQSVKSCGCLLKEARLRKRKIKDLTGLRFGKLVVLKMIGFKNTNTVWLCKCDCGNTTQVRSNDLQSRKGVLSCGCVRRKMSKMTIQERRKQGKENRLKAKLCSELDMTWDEAGKQIEKITSKTLKELI